MPEQHFYKQALETFKTNVALFPDSWNAYDSYAEALLADGQKEKAIKMYQKSLEINPKSESGQKVLQKILGNGKRCEWLVGRLTLAVFAKCFIPVLHKINNRFTTFILTIVVSLAKHDRENCFKLF